MPASGVWFLATTVPVTRPPVSRTASMPAASPSVGTSTSSAKPRVRRCRTTRRSSRPCPTNSTCRRRHAACRSSTSRPGPSAPAGHVVPVVLPRFVAIGAHRDALDRCAAGALDDADSRWSPTLSAASMPVDVLPARQGDPRRLLERPRVVVALLEVAPGSSRTRCTRRGRDDVKEYRPSQSGVGAARRTASTSPFQRYRLTPAQTGDPALSVTRPEIRPYDWTTASTPLTSVLLAHRDAVGRGEGRLVVPPLADDVRTR